MSLSSLSWGRFPLPENQSEINYSPQVNLGKTTPCLPRGLGRSYGDSCLISNGTLLKSHNLDHFLEFNEQSGVLKVQAGVSLQSILLTFAPRGWFLPVCPGTQIVTVGGAIANDIHGKNHHRNSSFGNHVLELELVRSDGENLRCNAKDNPQMFSASIGGLGLTGFIHQASIQMQKIPGTAIAQEQIRFHGLEDFLQLSRDSNDTHEFTVAWVDIAKNPIRGIFMRGNFTAEQTPRPSRKPIPIPKWTPSILLNPLSIRLFNELYYFKNFKSFQKSVTSYIPFFFPLDAILGWNQLYGPKGFLQYQLYIPESTAMLNQLRQILAVLQKANPGSFLSVLKQFGSQKSPGLLSFPGPGLTLTVDFPIANPDLFELLDRCDKMLIDFGGRLYLAKDSRMSRESFRHFYPQYKEFLKFKDPQMTSDLWRRVCPKE